MRLILLRHTESLKNVNNQFSSETDEESLTERGKGECSIIARDIHNFMIRKNLACHNIYTANSVRSIDTARIIADELNAKVQVEEALRSTKPGTLSGKSEAEAIKTNPEFIEQLYLFRNGLFNAYDFTVAENKEPKKDFEKRVLSCLSVILSDESENVKIIIAHRSSITCILLDIARRYYKYPANFSGHIPLDLGRLSLTEKTTDNKWRILRVNSESSELNTL
jgi:broad specificity phosphatase PhoE